MKLNITKCDFNGNDDDLGLCYKYDEVCDRCGQPSYPDPIVKFTKPDTSEVDFCAQCLREFIDCEIPYEVVKNKYKRIRV